MVREIVTTVVGVAALAAYFRTVRTEWPHAYFPVGRRLETQLSESPIRFAVYRFVPIAVAAAIAGATLEKVGRSPVVPMIAIGLLHAATTTGRGVWAASRRLDGPISVTRGLAHGVVGLGCVAAAAAPIPLAPVLSRHVPKTETLVAALWTAGFAALAGGWLLSLARDDRDPSAAREDAFRKARRTIGDELWTRSADVAREVGADERVVQAVLIVENTQRPYWLRQMEKVVGRWASSGSYGPLQVQGLGKGKSERDELDEAIRRRFTGQRFADAHGESDRRWRKLFFRSYNGDPQWCADAEAAYSWLEYAGSSAFAHSESIADDGLPQIEVTRFVDTGDHVTIEGTALADEPSVVVVQWSSTLGELSREYVAIVGPAGQRKRWKWTAPRQAVATAVVVRKPTLDEQLQEVRAQADTTPLVADDPVGGEMNDWQGGEGIELPLPDGMGPTQNDHPAWDLYAEQPVDFLALPLRPVLP